MLTRAGYSFSSKTNMKSSEGFCASVVFIKNTESNTGWYDLAVLHQ